MLVVPSRLPRVEFPSTALYGLRSISPSGAETWEEPQQWVDRVEWNVRLLSELRLQMGTSLVTRALATLRGYATRSYPTSSMTASSYSFAITSSAKRSSDASVSSCVAPGNLRTRSVTPAASNSRMSSATCSGVAGEALPAAVRGGRRFGGVQPRRVVGKAHVSRVAARLRGVLMVHSRKRLFYLRQRAHGVGGVVADGVPLVGETAGASQGRGALAAHPDGRMGLLHRLGLEVEIGEAAELAVEGGRLAGPQLLECANVLGGDGAAAVEVGRAGWPRTPPAASPRRSPR